MIEKFITANLQGGDSKSQLKLLVWLCNWKVDCLGYILTIQKNSSSQ